jgi:arginase
MAAIMESSTAYDVCVIGAPSSAGAYAPGQEKAPAALRRHGLIAALRAGGLSVSDVGDVAGFRWRPDLDNPKAMNAGAAAAVAGAVADRVAQAVETARRVLVLGGDCTVELGTVAGATRSCASVGMIYVDLDVDLNAPETSDGALDWTGVAHLLDIPGAAGALAGLGPRRPMLRPHEVLFVAAGNITPPERATIDRLGLPVIGLDAVAADLGAAAKRATDWAASFERLLIHVDVDVLSYVHFPIAENVRRRAGVLPGQLSELLVTLARAPNFKALTLTEVNPDHAPDEGRACQALNRMLTDVMRSACGRTG